MFLLSVSTVRKCRIWRWLLIAVALVMLGGLLLPTRGMAMDGLDPVIHLTSAGAPACSDDGKASCASESFAVDFIQTVSYEFDCHGNPPIPIPWLKIAAALFGIEIPLGLPDPTPETAICFLLAQGSTFRVYESGNPSPIVDEMYVGLKHEGQFTVHPDRTYEMMLIGHGRDFREIAEANGATFDSFANLTYQEIDPNDESCENALSFDLPYSGNLEFSGDHDWQRIQSPVKGTMILTLDVPPDKDYQLEVRDDACSTVWVLSQNGTGIDERFVIPVDSAYYRIHVYGKSAEDWGESYTVSAKWDLNDDQWENAKYFDTPYSGNLEYGGDQDWQRIHVPAGNMFLMLDVPDGSNYELELWQDDAMVQLAASTNPVGVDESILITQPGYYRIHIFGANDKIDFNALYRVFIKEGGNLGGELSPDAHTVLLDHLNGTALGETYGPLSYVESLTSNLQLAADLQTGMYIRYDLPSWYCSYDSYDPSGKEGTIELWINPLEHSSGILTFQWNLTGSPPAAGYILGLNIDNDGKLQYNHWSSVHGAPLPPPEGYSPSGTTTIPVNKWTHIAASWGPAGTKLYVNGVLEGYTPFNAYPAIGWFCSPYLYAYINPWGESDMGHKYIDELHISTVQRTDAEILAHYKQASPPTTTISITGTPGNNGWYRSDIVVTLSATDNSSSGVLKTEYGFASSLDAGCPGPWYTYTTPIQGTLEGSGYLVYRSIDKVGNIEPCQKQFIGVDKTPPAIQVYSPQSTNYLHSATFVFLWKPFEKGSGLDTYSTMLDGHPILNDQMIDLFFLKLGTHTVTIQASDMAGNSTAISIPFNVVANIDSLLAITKRAFDLGWINKQSVYNSLDARLQATKQNIDLGRYQIAKRQLIAFILQLKSYNGKSVTQRAYDLLKTDALYVLLHLP